MFHIERSIKLYCSFQLTQSLSICLLQKDTEARNAYIPASQAMTFHMKNNSDIQWHMLQWTWAKMGSLFSRSKLPANYHQRARRAACHRKRSTPQSCTLRRLVNVYAPIYVREFAAYYFRLPALTGRLARSPKSYAENKIA